MRTGHSDDAVLSMICRPCSFLLSFFSLLQALYDVVADEGDTAMGTATVRVDPPRRSSNAAPFAQDQPMSGFRVVQPTLYDATSLPT